MRYFIEFDRAWELVAGRYFLPGHWPERLDEDDETYRKLYEELRTLNLFASKQVADLAEQAIKVLRRFDRLPPHQGETDGQAQQLEKRLRAVYDRLRDLMRADLGVPASHPRLPLATLRLRRPKYFGRRRNAGFCTAAPEANGT